MPGKSTTTRMVAAALETLCGDAEKAVQEGYNILILSDRSVSAERIPIPALLAVGYASNGHVQAVNCVRGAGEA